MFDEARDVTARFDRQRNVPMRAADGDRGRDRDPDLTGSIFGRGGPGAERFRLDPGDPPIDERTGLDLSGLETRSKDDLYQIARRLRIDGRCRMTREELIDAIRGQG